MYHFFIARIWTGYQLTDETSQLEIFKREEIAFPESCFQPGLIKADSQ